MAEIYKQYPEWRAYKYQAVADAVKQFGPGHKPGESVKSIGVAMDHLSTLEEAAKALDNGDVRLFNSAANFFSENFGGTTVTDFNSLKNLVADEVVKGVVGGPGGVGDREEAGAKIRASNSPKQMLGVISGWKDLMAGQLLGLRRQYKAATGLDDFNDRILADQPETINLLTTHEERVKSKEQGAAPAGDAQNYQEGQTATNAKGDRMIFRGGQWQPIQ